MGSRWAATARVVRGGWFSPRGASVVVALAGAALAPGPAHAQGHMLHGAGPIGSSMGGAGTALVTDSVNALMFNPALIGAYTGNQITFSSEFFEDGIEIQTTLALPWDPDGIAGTESGVTDLPRRLGVVPAFGWMSRHPQKKLALGFGLIGIAGFSTDYPEDRDSVLFAAPPLGFGRIFTDYRLTKIPVALAYQVTPKLSLGMSINVYYGEFAVDPLPHKVFDVDASGTRWYAGGGNLDGSWAVAGQFGFFYQATPGFSIGGSITTPQNFAPYEWNTTFRDPSSPDYGKHRRVDFDLDGPLIASFGTGLRLGDKARLAVDGMFTKYRGVEGFGSPGGVVDGIIYPFGWRNIWTVKAGLEYEASDKLTVRLGYNYSQTPLRAEVILTGTGAPATFEHHFCGGAGVQLFPFLSAEASFYYVPRKHITGPLPAIDGTVVGSMTTSNTLSSALVGLNFTF